MTLVEFLHDCADDRAGERKPIDDRRAKRLAWTGYVRILESEETAAVDGGAEKAVKMSGVSRRERRG